MTMQDDITQLQESQLFLDRRLDELNEAILDIATRLQSAIDALARMESRMNAISDSIAEGAAPPDDDATSPPQLD